MDSDYNFKEKRIRQIALAYYSRKDVRDAIFNFSKKREISPKYFNGFGKRPDSFQYPGDITQLVKKGATSFHCSEEIWRSPLDLDTSFSVEQYNEIREGWDLIIDIDCKWIEYSKKAAISIIKALEYRGVRNIGIKFSGNKGFHIIVPWKAFPKYFGSKKTREMFPEFPRSIANYLKEIARPILEELIKDEIHEFTNLDGFTGVKCETCNNLASENFQITLACRNYHMPHIETFSSGSLNYGKRKCPICNKLLQEEKKEKFYRCNYCGLESLKDKNNFNEKIVATDIFKILGLDVLLVSSRHLFRMPYSLHEKTALSSVVIREADLETFSIKDADPLNVKVLEFYPLADPGEATTLLMEAIDFQKSLDRKQDSRKIKFEGAHEDRKFEKIKLDTIDESWFPPPIKNILNGMVDGRKRALFILLNLFRSLGMSMENLEKRINVWNKLNKPPLKKGYIDSQLIWHSKHPVMLPPNFNNEIYKAIGVYEIDDLSRKVKNPVNYVVRKSRAWKKR